MKYFLVCSTLLFVSCCVIGAPQFSAQRSESAFDPLPDSFRSFNRKLYRKLSRSEKGNFVYSPFSLHMIMSLALLGAPKGSTTSQELMNLLDYKSHLFDKYLSRYLEILTNQVETELNDGIQIELANRIFAAESIKVKEDYIKKVDKFYKSTIQRLDFTDPSESTKMINNFVSNQTNGIIPTLFDEDSIDGLSKLIMVNAIYFKGKWLFPFDVSDTQPMTFNVNQHRSIQYPHGMNLVKDLRMASIDELDADILELPYEGKHFTMVIVLPKPGYTIEHLDHYMGRFDTKRFDERLDQESIRSEVTINIPRFETSFEWNQLGATLRQFGVETLFNPEKANLTNISDDPIYVSKAIHKSVIKVNEEGSEAAAASGVVLNTRSSLSPDQKSFIVDRPFIFYIYDKSNNVPLFFGRIVDPSGVYDLNDKGGNENVISEKLCDQNGINIANDSSISWPCKEGNLLHIQHSENLNQEVEDSRWNDAFESTN